MKSNKGFSMVEMAIVMVIVGLIVSGLLVGRDLIRQAELKSILKDFQSYETAIGTFSVKYLSLPGDMRNASDFWAATADGGGNGQIDTVAEQFDAWQQLSLSNILQGSFDGEEDADDLGISVPDSSITGAGFHFSNWAPYLTPVRNAIVFGTPEGSSFMWGDSLDPIEATGIDTKADDGNPFTGTIFAGNGGAQPQATGCVNIGTGTAAGGGDDWDYTPPDEINCFLSFTIE